MPASTMRSSVSGSCEAGPIVATILVRRIGARYRAPWSCTPVALVRRAHGARAPTRRGVRRGVRVASLRVLPSRPVPHVGARARIVHFGGGSEAGVVLAVYEDGRRLQVRGEEGEVLEFVLSPATARFVSAAGAHGPRLELPGGA